jgi:CheY-like chemotaxis protein
MARSQAASPRVLIVDDDVETHPTLRRMLGEEGIEVVGAAVDGFEVLAFTDRLRPDVILMDLRMPVVGGLEATRQVKHAFPWVQVIILTVYDEPLPAMSAEEAGAFAYLVKGCSPALIRDVILQAWRHAAEARHGSGQT